MTGVAKLSPRQRQCLRLVYDRRTSKEIASHLGIDPSTVDNYIADAVRILGARNRRMAAEQLIAADDLEGEESTPPRELGDRESRVVPLPPEEAGTGPSKTQGARLRLPFRPSGATHNELTTFERFAWLPISTIALAIGFGMLVVGLRVLGDLVSGLVALGR